MSGAATAYISHPGQCCEGWCVEVANVEVHALADKDTAENVRDALARAVKSTAIEVGDAYRNLLDEYAASVDPAPYTTERALFQRLRHLAYPPEPAAEPQPEERP